MSKVVSKILVPIGFSDQSIIAMEQAMNLAKIKNSEVVLISVIEERNTMLSLLMDDDDELDKLKKKVVDKLNEIAKEYTQKYDINIETMVARGSVYDKISEVAEMLNVDLIVMGTNGSPKGITKRFIGSNAEKVVRSSKCPVITIKGKDHKLGCENIILPLDLGKETKEKVTYAIQYARYWKSTIRVVSVVLKGNDHLKDRLNRNLKQVYNFISDAGVDCTIELLESDKKITLSTAILDYERKFRSDLIMIMTKKEESLSDSLSVTARSIIYNSDIPVMSIHPQARRMLTGPTTAF